MKVHLRRVYRVSEVVGDQSGKALGTLLGAFLLEFVAGPSSEKLHEGFLFVAVKPSDSLLTKECRISPPRLRAPNGEGATPNRGRGHVTTED